MKKIIVLTIIFILLANPVLAQIDLTEELKSNWDEIKGKELPGFTKKLFGDERINIYITLDDGNEIVISLVVEDGKFKQLSFKELEDATLNVRGTEEIIKKIKDAKNPLAAFRKALDEKEVDYSAVGLVKKIKFGATSFVLKIASWFGFGKKK